MQLRTLIVMLLLCALGQQAFTQTTSTKRYQGLLWEISGKGTTRPSYLYGTMHVPEKLAYNLSDSFFIAIRHCDFVSLETNHDIWQEFMQKMKEDNETFGYAEGGMYNRTYSNYGNYSDLYGQSFKFEAPDSRLFEGMFAYKPVMANEFLYRTNGFGDDFEEDTYLDLFIFQAGKKLGKTVIGLETMDGSYESVTRARIPDDDEKDKIGMYDRKYVSPFSIRDAYRKQDLNALDSLNTLLSPGKNFRKWMLEERNIVMANGIDSIAKMGKTMFSAVGAAHLPGDIGVIEQLRKRGYTVRPVQFSFDTDKKDMQDIQNMRYPVTFATQWAPDSVWSAEAPGKFYTTSDIWRIEQSLCADMSNGAYYAAYRIKTNGLWTGQSPEFISTRIDSIIYEKVPGKIQERKRLDTPFPGHDITTRTRRGDIQRYRLYITPSEILVFIMGGNGDYVAGDEGKRFFNSIKLNPEKTVSKAIPTTVAPPSGNIQVTFPVVPFVNTTKDKDSKEFYIAGQEKNPDDGYYFLTRVTYNDYYYIEEDTFELNIIAEKIAAQFTKEKPVLTPGSLSPHPTQTFQFKSDKDSSFYFGKLVIDGPQYYLLGARNKTGKSPDAFFNSFSLKTGQQDQWMEKKDTSGRFVVMVPKKEEKQPSQLYLNMKKINEEIMKKSRALYGEDEYYNSYYELSYGSVLRNESTGEAVAVSVNKSYIQGYPDVDSLRRSMDKSATNYKTFELVSKDFQKQGDTLLVFTYTVKDTNSNRGIMTKEWIGNNVRYQTSANINLDQPVSPFVQKVFSTFTPTDTSLHQRIQFGGRDISFLDRIYAQDSVERKKALQSMRDFNSRKYEPGDFDRLMKLIQHPEYNKLKFNDRSRLVNSLAATKSPKVLPYLKNYFYTHADSMRYQNVALSAMAQLNTKEGFETVLDLLKQKETYADYNTLDAIRYNLADTAELAKKMVPELMDLVENEAYTSMVLGIMASLYEKGMIKPKAYKSLKPKFMAQEYQTLGRTRYQEEASKDKSASDYRYGRYNSGGYGGDYGGGYGGGYGSGYGYGGYDDYGYNYTNTSGLNFLMGFYDDDEEVRRLFNEVLVKGDTYSKMSAIDLLMKNGKKVPNSILEPLAKEDETRFRLYSSVVTNGLLGEYKAWFTDTLAIARSYVLQNMPKEDLDSVKFIQKNKAITYDKKPAYIYFFEVKRKKATDWTLNYVTLPLDFGLKGPEKKKQGKAQDGDEWNYTPPTTYGYNSAGRAFQVMVESNLNTEKDKREFIQKKVNEIRFAGRNRYREERKNYYDY